MDLIIRKKNEDERIPRDLLFLADPSREQIEKYLKEGQVYLAFLGDELVGEYVLEKIELETFELKNLAVDKKHQGKGIGKILVLDAIEKAKEQKAKSIEVGTGNSSLLQLALYKKCGLEIIGVEKDFFVKNYPEPIIENGIRCTDMIRLAINF